MIKQENKQPEQDNILAEVVTRTRLQEGIAGVTRVLRGIYILTNTVVAGEIPAIAGEEKARRITSKELAHYTRLPIPVLTAVRRELEKVGLLASGVPGGGIALTTEGLLFVRDQIGVVLAPSLDCPTCAGRGQIVPSIYQQALAKLEIYARDMPEVDTTLDQAFATPLTALRRALLMLEQGALEGRAVLLLGDDDSLSLAIRLVERALLAGEQSRKTLTSRLMIIDIDNRILEHLQAALAQENLPLVETLKHDLRFPLPETLQGKFDTFATDSAYTVNGAALFLSRGIEGLDNGEGRQVFFSYGHKPPLETVKLQDTLTRSGLALAALHTSFNEYTGAETLGNTSDLYQLVTTRQTSPLVTGPYEGTLYTAEERPSRREYVCSQCRASYQVGPGQRWPTIEVLKSNGCQNCGNHKFRPGQRFSAGHVSRQA